MSKVTAKFQVTVPQAIAKEYGIRPGDEINWIPAGEVIRILPAGRREDLTDAETRLRWFDQTTKRISKSGGTKKVPQRNVRGWSREELYNRGRAR